MTSLKKRKPKRLLKDLVIEEVSLVDAPANEGARVLLYKNLPDPSNALGIQLLRVLARRVENVRLGNNINRLEAWVQVLGTAEGQQLLALVTKAKTDPTLIFKDMVDRDVSEICDFLEGRDADPFIKAVKKELKKGVRVSNEMKTVTKIFKKSFDSQIEAVNSLKLELTKRAPADDRRIPEKRLIDFLDSHSDVESAILELPNVAKVEVQEKPDFGPTYREIEKLAAELVIKGVVPTQEQGVVKIVKDNPDLYLQYVEEQI